MECKPQETNRCLLVPRDGKTLDSAGKTRRDSVVALSATGIDSIVHSVNLFDEVVVHSSVNHLKFCIGQRVRAQGADDVPPEVFVSTWDQVAIAYTRPAELSFVL